MSCIGIDSVYESRIIFFEIGMAHTIGCEEIDSIKNLIISFPVAFLFLILGKPLLIICSELLEIANGQNDMLFEITIHILEFLLTFVGLAEQKVDIEIMLSSYKLYPF